MSIMNSRRILQFTVFLSAISALAVLWLLARTRNEQARELQQSEELDAAIQKQDQILAEKRIELDRLRAELRAKEAREERAQQAIMQGEVALAKNDWSGAETAFLSALREAPKLQAALDGWIKTQIKKSAPPNVTVQSCEFTGAGADKPRVVTIQWNINVMAPADAHFADFNNQLKKELETGDLNQKPLPPPHSVLREFLSVRFGAPESGTVKRTKNGTEQGTIKIEFVSSKAALSEQPPAER